MENLIVSTSPHIRTKTTTHMVMADVLIALSPAAVAAVILFGLRALLMIAVCVGTAVVSELLFNLIAKKPQTIKDLSAAVTGLILALSLPVKTQIWACIVGSVFAIVVVKCLFGGIGCNFANPAATARVMLLVAFSGSVAGGSATNFAELIGGATPLNAIKVGDLDSLPTIIDMLIGNRGGAIGEGCIVALVIGGVYLIVRRVIKWQIPALFIATVFFFSLIVKGNLTIALYEVLGGGVVLAAFFMITDYVTTPINFWGKLVFAFGAAILTCCLRFFVSENTVEGVSYAILIMNILSPYIEKLCQPKPLGKGGKAQ